MSIVCATNFSLQSARAADAAAELASRSGTRLWLVHALDAEAERLAGTVLRKSYQTLLDEEAHRLSRVGADVGTALLSGPVAPAVFDFAATHEVSLVLVGAPGDDAPFGGLGGSLDRLAQTSSLPLLVVKDAETFRAWARGLRPLRVMLGADRSQTSVIAAEWLGRLRQVGPVEVTAGYVYWPVEECERLGLARPLTYLDESPELHRTLERELTEHLTRSGGIPPVKVRVVPGLGRVAEELVALAQAESADVLVMGTRQRKALGKLWSVSNHALRLATMSVALVPGGAATLPAEVRPPQVKRVLAATDFSELGNSAVPYAFSMVQPGGVVHLVHVTAEFTLSDEQREEAKRRLRALVPAPSLREGKRAEVEVCSGPDAALLIAQAAERADVDLICMGTRRTSELQRVVLGSVAHGVMRASDRPVLLVRPSRASTSRW